MINTSSAHGLTQKSHFWCAMSQKCHNKLTIATGVIQSTTSLIKEY